MKASEEPLRNGREESIVVRDGLAAVTLPEILRSERVNCEVSPGCGARRYAMVSFCAVRMRVGLYGNCARTCGVRKASTLAGRRRRFLRSMTLKFSLRVCVCPDVGIWTGSSGRIAGLQRPPVVDPKACGTTGESEHFTSRVEEGGLQVCRGRRSWSV